MTKSTNNSQLVSVVLPTYNRAYCLGRTIQSVLDQTHTNWELIIVDNHSTDDTDKLVAGFNESRICLLKIHNNGVIAASRNRGLRAAKGEYIAFLDSDDWWLPKKLEESMRLLDESADIVYHDLYRVSSSPYKERFWKRERSRRVTAPVFRDLLNNGNAINNSSVVVKRRLMLEIGGFSEDPKLIGAEDYDAWVRLSSLTDKFVRIEAPLGYYWNGGGNITAPRRTLENLTRFREIYSDEFDCGTPGWMAYSLAKACYRDGRMNESAAFARIALSGGLSGFVTIRAAIIFLMALYSRGVATKSP